MREQIILNCSKCKEQNYIKTKNKKIQKDKLSLSKYCFKCLKHTNHNEKKMK